MTSIRKLKAIAGAGDIDEALAFRIDVIAAAGQVYEAHNALMKADRRNQFQRMEELDDAVSTLCIKYGRYKAALNRRER